MGSLKSAATYEVEVAVPGLPGHRCWFVVSEVNRRRLREAQSGEQLVGLPQVLLDCMVRWEGFLESDGEAPSSLPETPTDLLGYLEWGQVMELALRLSRAVQPLWSEHRERAIFSAALHNHELIMDELSEAGEAEQVRSMIRDAQLCCAYKWSPSEVLNMPCQLRDTILELIYQKKAPSGG